MSGGQLSGRRWDNAISIPLNQAVTVLRNIYQGAAGDPHQPVSITSLDHPVGTTAAALRPVLAHLEERGCVKVSDNETVLLTNEGVAEAVRRQ